MSMYIEMLSSTGMTVMKRREDKSNALFFFGDLRLTLNCY